jgi:hypothetical protein
MDGIGQLKNTKMKMILKIALHFIIKKIKTILLKKIKIK